MGIGAGLVDAYRKLGHQVVATARTVHPSRDPDALTVQGDNADPANSETRQCSSIAARMPLSGSIACSLR
ncbi:hypothetical protein ACWEGX_43390 [Streptomyces chartreusis]